MLVRPRHTWAAPQEHVTRAHERGWRVREQVPRALRPHARRLFVAHAEPLHSPAQIMQLQLCVDVRRQDRRGMPHEPLRHLEAHACACERGPERDAQRGEVEDALVTILKELNEELAA